MPAFAGFPKQTLTFLRNVEKNNSKAWFDAHRADYDDYWVAPAKDFVEAAGEALQKVAPVSFEPRVNGSIFRINRDTRFSKDKRPYKSHLDFWFWEAPTRKEAVSGFYLRVTAKQVGIGVGAHGFDKDRLAAYRGAVVDPAAGDELVKAVKKVERAGWEVKGEHYKTLPRGFEAPDDLRHRLLRYNALWCGEDDGIPPELHTKAFVGYAVSRWRKLAPIHRWLVDTLGAG